MGCQIQLTPSAKRDIRSLPNPAVGNEFRAWTDRIANNPLAAPEGMSHGHRMLDGMLIAGGKTYYGQIIYHHVADSGIATLIRVLCEESPGMH